MWRPEASCRSIEAMSTTDPPPPQGARRPWSDLPPRLRRALEAWWGREVAGSESQPGGFSPGIAARLRAADGSRLFVKAVGPEPNPDSPAFHRREIAIASQLPAEAPAPRLRWWLDEGAGGWVLLAFDDIPGIGPALPWRASDIERVMAALTELGAALTPSPLPPGSVSGAPEAFAHTICGWRRLRDEPPSPPLDDWSRSHLDRLAELEAEAGAVARGSTLLHFDLRADNMVLTRERVWFVDWPHAHIGAAWIDGLLLAPSVAMQGGPQPEDLLAQLPGYRRADRHAVTAVIAATAGFFTHRSLQPPPAGLPTIRAFQAAQGVVCREWLADRLGWHRP